METLSVVFYDALQLFLYLLLAHFISDFLLQPEKLLLWKKSSNKGILAHVSVHFIVTSIILAPFIFMAGSENPFAGALTLLCIFGIAFVHFFIDMEKIRLEKKYPTFSFKLYLADQCAHISVIIIFTIIMNLFASVELSNTFIGEIYFSKQIVLYFISLVLVTYFWEITKYEKIRNDKKNTKPFSPNIKSMMIKGFIVSAIFVLFTPLTVFAVNPLYAQPGARTANILDIVPKQFSFGDTVTIKGSGFGDEMTIYSQVCWGKLCINKDSITKWSDTEIQFKMNVLGMPLQGMLHVVRLNESGLYTEDADGSNVTVLPTIAKFFDDKGNQIFSLTSGEMVTVTGYYFSDILGVLKLDDKYVSQIQPWTTNQITFLVPQLDNTSNTFTVQRRDGGKVIHDITSHVGLSNDEFSHLQTYLFNAQVDHAWQAFKTRGEGVTIAILDDGVDVTHPDLSKAIWVNSGEIKGDGIDNDKNGYVDDVNGYNFRDNNGDMKPKGDHGTLVAGVIAATANNSIGIAGIAPGVKIMPLVVCGLENCSGQAVFDAVRYAVDNGVNIINMSLTGFGDNPIFDPTYNQVMQYAHDRGVFVVVAAGNGNQELAKAQKYYGRNFDTNPISPVCNDGSSNWVFGVASIDAQLSNSVFSDFGSNCIDISAYGEAVYSTSVAEFSADGKIYGYAYGTSFATPQVSGALALAMSEFPNKGIEELKGALIGSGFELDQNLALEFKGNFAKGLDVYRFLSILQGTPDTEQTVPNTTPVVNDSNNDNIISGLFSDIGTTHRSYMAITYLSNQGVIEGYSDGSFKPENDVNRAELLKLLVGGQGIDPDVNRYRNCFTDVHEEWFARYVCYAKSKGWVDGYSDGSFRPAQTVNKVEALKMMIESYGLSIGEDAATFVDVNSDDWFAGYVGLGQKLGILEERGALFNPSRGKSRASIAENIFRILAVQGRSAETYTPELGQEFIAQ